MESVRSSFLFIIWLLAATTGLSLASWQGCYRESVRKRHFSISPGNYNPEITTPTTCRSSCGAFSYLYAAVTSGKFCYCANLLPPVSELITNSSCNSVCAGDPKENCGGLRQASVFTSAERISGLSLTSNVEDKIVPVGTTVTLQVSINSGSDVIYEFDYDDGSIITSPNSTDMLSAVYNSPGQYSVMVYANDDKNSFQDQLAATIVRIDAPPKQVEVECSSVFATFEKGNCSCVVWWGTSLSLAVYVSIFSFSFYIEDPPLSLTGPAMNSKNIVAGDNSRALYLLYASDFSVTGKIIGWEMISQTGGSVTVLILQPDCGSENYCYSSNTCLKTGCDSTTSIVTTCLSNERFCVQSAMCQSPTGSQVSRNALPIAKYKVVQIVTLAAPSAGYVFLEEKTNITVEPGFILGLQHDGSQAILQRLSCLSTACDAQLTYVNSLPGSTIDTSSRTNLTVRHAIRAIASAGSKVFLPFTFTQAGNFTLNVVATSNTLTNVPKADANTTVVVLEGINASVISGPVYAATGENVIFTVLPHTGNNVFYTWLINDRPEFNDTRDQDITFSFPIKGNYSVNVTAYNAVSSKSNGTEIIVQDKVVGLALVADPTVVSAVTNISLTLSGGSSYTCTWNFGDRSTQVLVSEKDAPLSGSTIQHTYQNVGSYDVSVTCANDVSTNSSVITLHVLETITNLNVPVTGAEKGRDYYLEWQVSSGTNITFIVTFDGRIITGYNNINKYQWRTSLQPARAPTIIPLSIVAKNLVSSDNVTLNFEILTLIVNPILTSSTLNTTNNVVVTFTVNMAAGTGVTVNIEFGDGINDKKVQPSGNEWAGPVTFNHVYRDGGLFTVTANFSNAAGWYVKHLQLQVLVGIQAINCSLVEYALYHPPAVAELTIGSAAMPTNPKLVILWGERQSQPTTYDLKLNSPYTHTYGDTGKFIVTANVSNQMGQTMCIKEITIVEKLDGPSFEQRFSCAALGLPFSVTFCLFRGPSNELCNLTFNFNDSKPEQVFVRQGSGKDGCDTHNVTFMDRTPKTITVTATSPLQSVTDSLVVTIIDGIKDEDIDVTCSRNVTLKSQTQLTVEYVGSVVPTAAFVKFDFGDGTELGPSELNITTLNRKREFYHEYKSDGLFQVLVTVFNSATSVEKIVTAEVFQNFSNLRIEMFYLADIPPDTKTFGLAGSPNLFPANKPVQFLVLDDNNAFATAVDIKITNSQANVAFQRTFSSKEFFVLLNESESYTADVTVINPQCIGTIPSKSFTVFELVEGLSLSEQQAKVRVNEHKILNITFTKTGTDTCLYVNFGDGFLAIFSDVIASCVRSDFRSVKKGNKQPLKGLTLLDHIYTSEGFFLVTVVAENIHSSETTTIGFSITALDCEKPAVDIHNRHNYFTYPEVYRNSDRIQVQGLSNIKCASSYDNVKSWSVQRINETDDTVISIISLVGVDTTKAQLDLESRFLGVGLFKVYFTMTMRGPYSRNKFESTIYTYIKTIQSDLIGVMIPGGPSHVYRGVSQNLVLDPLVQSQDPDVDPNGVQGLVVSNWTCEMLNNTSETCVKAGFNPKAQSQNLIIGKLPLGTYRFTATLSKDVREVLTELYMTVVKGTPPTLSIRPATGYVYYQLSDSYKILKSSRFALNCECTSCAASDSPSYLWNVNLMDYRWPESWRLLGPDDLRDNVMGQNSQELLLEPDLFEMFNAVHLRVDCMATVGGETGKISADLKINGPPVPGTCTVTPKNRTITTEKAWTVSVSGWSDSDGLAGLQLSIHTDSSSVDKQVTSMDTSSGDYEFQVCLSEGPYYNNYRQNLLLTVRDVLGGITVADCGIVEVRPMSVSEIRALTQDIMTNKLNEVKRVLAEGDQNTCTEQATNIVSLLNSDNHCKEECHDGILSILWHPLQLMFGSERIDIVPPSDNCIEELRREYSGLNVASNFVNTQYGPEDQNRPAYMNKNESARNVYLEYQMESQRDARAKVRSELIKDVLQLSFPTVVSVQQVLSFLAEATLYGDEIVQTTQLDVIAAVHRMMNFLTDPANTKNVPPDDIEAAMRNALAVIGCLMDAVGKNGFHGTLSELKDATKDEKFKDYDTSIKYIGAADDLSSAATFADAQRMRTDQVHKYRQAITSDIVRDQVTGVLDQTAKCFASYSVPGQIMETSSLKLKQKMIKTAAESLKGTQQCVPGCEGGVVFPNSSFPSDLESQASFVLSVSQTTSFTALYSDMAEEISPTSNFITINLHSENGTKLSVQNLSEPFEVTIPRDINVKDVDYETVDPKISKWSNLMAFVVNLKKGQCAIHMDFANITGRQFLLVIKRGMMPLISSDPATDQCDFVARVPEYMSQNLDDAERYRYFLSNEFIGDFKGDVFLGLRELLIPGEADLDLSRGCASVPRYANGSDYFQGKFGLKMYTSRCLTISDSEKEWSTKGCVVSKKTNFKKTVCRCTHMTTFAGGWVVVPNTIDWNYVFANADFLTNPTIYITVIVIAVLYLISAILARYKDKKMAEQLGLAPLCDNDPRDKCFYEVIVCTGMRRNAGTESQVCFILSGEDDETDVRVFSDNKRKIFRRGQIDGFLMAVPRPLGYLNFMRVWHDNSGSGKFGSWYLNYIMVRDIQTDIKHLFIANKWFAVEEDDGQVDRVIPVANQEQLSDFSYQFGERSRKNFADGHLWFSVIARPPQSRFTCLQRVSCCLCLLYVTMLANAMFYNTTSQEETASNSFSFGPFSIAPEQIFIGVVSNLIVFPFNFLLVFLFNKSRPHHKRPSRIDLAIKEVHDQNKQTNINDIKPEVSSIFSVAKSPCLPKSPHDPPEMSTSRPGTAMSNTSTQELTPRKKKKKCELPWYFTIVAWLLLWLITLGSMALVIFYGISFKDETCRKWITSMLVSFFMSVFVTQPIKVILFAVILSLIIKNPGEENEDEEEDEEEPNIDQDRELLHGNNYAVDMTRPRKIGYKPPDPQILEKLREKRLKEIKMWEIIREVIVYAFFLWILMVISYRQMGASNFLYKDTLYKVFIANKDTQIDFFAIRNTDEFWTWTTSGLVNGLRAGPYYNDYPPLKLRAYINDKVSRIMGYATMRQLRIRQGQCGVPEQVHEIIHECNVAYNMFDQEEGSFGIGWKPLKEGESLNDTRTEYTYTPAKELNGYPYWGTLGWYSGGGYVVRMDGSKKELIFQMEQLQQEGWLDRYTRAVFLEFTVYNPQVNLFAISTILAEFHASGGLVASVRFEPAMLLPYMTSAMLFQIVCEVVYVLFALFFIVRELRELFKAKLNYFRNFWNLVEIGIISMSISAIVIFFYRLIVTNELTKAFKETKGNGYVKFQYVAYWNETFSYMIGFLCFLATLKFLKLLRFNRKMSMLSATLKFSATSLLHFGIIFLIVFLAFAQLFYLTYMHISVDYATFVSSMVAGVLMMMGKFDILSLIMAEPVLTQIFVLLFVITVTFILVNMFVTILNETFSAVREDINKQGNDYEIVNFMLLRFKQWTGLGSQEETTLVPGDLNDLNNSHGILASQNKTDHIGDFPDRIERLLQTISSVYMDNDNLAQLYQKKPYESQSGNKNLLRTGLSPSTGQSHNQKRKDSSDIIARVHTH